MKSLIILILAALILLTFRFSMAQVQLITPPSITHNVVVQQNVQPSQCPSSYRGQTSQRTATVISGYGMDTSVSQVGVLSCTGCIINNAGDCVCDTCYGNYN